MKFAFVLTLLLSSLGNAQQKPEVERLELVISAPPGILISRLNPPKLKLSSPFDGTILGAEVSGTPWRDKPKVYYAELNPVTWQLKVPAGTEPGTYQAPLEATFSLCSLARGFCFTTQQNAVFTFQVGSQKENVPVVLRLSQPQ